MVVGENTQMVPMEDVCVADEQKVLCIIRDMVDPQSCAVKHTMNLPASMSVRLMVNEVAKQFGYVIGSISVHYERHVSGGQIEEVCLEHFSDGVLADLVVRGVKRHNFTICELDGQLPQKMPPAPPPKVESPGSSPVNLNASTYFSSNTEVDATKPVYQGPSYTSSEFSYASALMKSDTGYVGLVNQAMTCYLNSLIQSLFMTPEFRNAIYRWKSSEKDVGVKNIPYQLQRLFLLLQTSTKRAAETTDLTKSFGWDSSEVWQQHDVQELCRVMFDALEVTWRNTDQAKLINQLYQGRMKDYVKCLECGYESARVDTYLDIPLVIRPFGSTDAYASVDEALRAFVQPEILEGRDQYFCEKCNKKCDAHKGLKFLSFPYMLTMQMKRFDFDYTTMHRIKLNDRMTFPEVLNLNHLIDTPEESLSEPETAGESISNGAAGGTSTDATASLLNGPGPPDEAIDEGIEVETCTPSTSYNSESSQSSEALTNDRNTIHSDAKGVYVYELFSIMIHSGSAAGGHYYAYIKDLTDGQWYSFNDQQVTKITYDDIRKTYGGSSNTRGYYSSAYTSSTSAYMLMYRRIDKEWNTTFMSMEDLPMHMKEELRRINDKQEAERLQKELDKSTCKIKLFCSHPSQRRKLDHRLEINKDKTLLEATKMAYKLFELEDVVPLDCCRIVKYDEYQDSLECSFKDEDSSTMEKLLGGVKQSYSFDLLMETKRPEQLFQEYKPGGVTVKVYVADMETDTIVEPPFSVRAYLVQTVEEFKKIVTQVMSLPDANMRCVLERFHNELKLLSTPAKTLKSEGFFKTNKVYIESNGSMEDQCVGFQMSKFYRLLDRHQNTIRIHVNLPSHAEVEEFRRISCSQEHSPTGRDSAVESGVNSAENSVDNGVDNGVDTTVDNGVDTTVGLCNVGRDPLEVDEGISDRSDSDIDVRLRTLSLQTRISRSDPNIYQSCQQEDSYSLQGQTSPTSRSPSTQSTSTSAEFAVPANLGCDDLSRSIDDITSPTDNGQLVPAACCNDLDLSIKGSHVVPLRFNSGSPVEDTYSEPDLRNSMSPNVNSPTDEKDVDFKTEYGEAVINEAAELPRTEDWDLQCSSSGDTGLGSGVSSSHSGLDHDDDMKRYFKAELADSTDSQRSLVVFVDKRITLGEFKQEIESYVGVAAETFKVFRVYSNNQEFESIRLGETLSFLEDGKINIKLGRALKNGEYRVKVFQLLVNDPEPSKFLLDTIFARGMTVLQSKQQILPDLKLEHNIDIPLHRCRLRKKTWKNPGTIYVDGQVYEDEIPIYPNWEVFMELLPEPERMLSTAQLAVYARQWWPARYELGPFQEVIILQQTVDELKLKLAELSGVDVENIEIAKGRGTFPYDVSLLEIHTDLDWNPPVTSLGMWPLYICDDGSLVYYRDKTETLLELDEDKKKALQNTENARLSKINQRISYSPRKEKALKIYTEESLPTTTSATIDY